MLTMEMLERAAPAAFSTHTPMTDRYVQVPTFKVVEKLADAGYYPVSAKQDNPSRRDPRYVSHAITLRHSDFLEPEVSKIEQVPQIILLNSHNGRTKMRVFAGFYRFVCANGMVVGRDLFRYEIRHVGDAFTEVLGFADMMTKELDQLGNVITEWSQIDLKVADQQNFAQRAAELRFGESAKSYNVGDILAVRRNEDAANDLWHVFNRIQENTTMGGIVGENANRRAVRSRPLTAVNPNIYYNAELWNLAEQYARAA
jgi:hypothetical protein